MQPKSTRGITSNDDIDRPPFGSRFLLPEHDVWSHSAWDSVPPPTDQGEIIARSLQRQRSAPVVDKEKYNFQPSKYWNDFYKSKANFFRDRKWLTREFSELLGLTESDSGERLIVEVGCGAGNAAFPILSFNENSRLRLHACDYATTAIDVVKRHPLYTSPPIGRIEASVWDLSSKFDLPEGVQEESADAVILIFVLSALSPTEWAQAVTNVHRMLKPGGVILLRDYGRHDLTQLRFKEGRLLSENFYIRGDGTRVYFFEIDQLARLFTGSSAPAGEVTITEGAEAEADDDGHVGEGTHDGVSGFATPDVNSTHEPTLNARASTNTTNLDPASPTSVHEALRFPALDESGITTPSDTLPPPPMRQAPHEEPRTSSSVSDINCRGDLQYPLFSIDQLRVDRRLLLNRKRQLKMYRVWMQAKFRKL